MRIAIQAQSPGAPERHADVYMDVAASEFVCRRCGVHSKYVPAGSKSQAHSSGHTVYAFSDFADTHAACAADDLVSH